MFQVQVDAGFSSTHQLRLPDGSNEPVHTHHWPVQVVVSGPATDAMGILIDFHWLSQMLEHVLGPLRNRNLNEHEELGGENPSAEHVARHIAEKLSKKLPENVQLVRVTVGEAPGCWASYLPDGQAGRSGR